MICMSMVAHFSDATTYQMISHTHAMAKASTIHKLALEEWTEEYRVVLGPISWGYLEHLQE